MVKKSKSEPKSDEGTDTKSLVTKVLREAVVEIRRQVAAGKVVATNLQVLVAYERSLAKHHDDSPADLDRRVRELEPAERQAMMREWAKLDGQKGSGLA